MHLVCNQDVRELHDNVCTQDAHFPVSKDNLISIYVTYHNDPSFQSIKHLLEYPIFRLVKLPQTRYDENLLFYRPIKPLLTFETQYTGMMLYSFIKRGMCTDFEALVKKYPDTDVFVFQWSPFDVYRDMASHGPVAEYLLKQIVHRMGLDPNHFHGVQAVWKNSWIGRSDLFKKYTDFAESAIQIMEKDPECVQHAQKDSGWNRGYSQEKLLAVYGKPYQTLHGFVMERLPAIFFKAVGARVQYIHALQEPSHPYCKMII